MNDVFRAHKKKVQERNSMAANRELDLTPRAERSGWSCFRCCLPGGSDDENENGTSETADESEHLIVEEEEITSRELDLPPEPDNDEYHDAVESKPNPNFVLAFWQLFMTVFFFSVWEGNDKKLTNGPSRSAASTTTTTAASEKKNA